MRNFVLMVLSVCVAALVAGAAETAKTYKVDDEGFIRSWLVLGSIALSDDAATHEEGSQKPILDKEWFKGQKEAAPKAGDKVKVGNDELTWKEFQADDYSLDLGKVAEANGKPAEKALFLGVAYVVAEQDMPDVKLAIGSDDSSMWQVNGKELIRAYSGRAVEKDSDTSAAIKLNKGVNVVKFAVINGDGPTGAAARFLDKSGQPVKNITITLTPPAK